VLPLVRDALWHDFHEYGHTRHCLGVSRHRYWMRPVQEGESRGQTAVRQLKGHQVPNLSMVQRRSGGFGNPNVLSAAARVAIVRLVALFRQWRRTSTAHAELARMSTRDLRDIGITRDERDRELDRRAWRF